jgi:hypothetical protein
MTDDELLLNVAKRLLVSADYLWMDAKPDVADHTVKIDGTVVLPDEEYRAVDRFVSASRTGL